MGIYREESFKRNSKGNWVKTNSKIKYNVPHDYGRWVRSCEIEKKSSAKEKTFLSYENTRGGLNKKVTEARTYFGPNEKVVRTLITTSNKLPKNFK